MKAERESASGERKCHNINRFLTFIFATMVLFSIVSMVSAWSQSWYLTDRTTGVPGGANYFMDKGSGAGTSNVSMGTEVDRYGLQMKQQQ